MMDTTEVRERVPEDLLERIRLLTTQAELIDRDVEALCRTFAAIAEDYEAQVDCCWDDDDDATHDALAEASGFDRLGWIMSVMALRAIHAAGGYAPRNTARELGFEGFGIDQEVSA